MVHDVAGAGLSANTGCAQATTKHMQFSPRTWSMLVRRLNNGGKEEGYGVADLETLFDLL